MASEYLKAYTMQVDRSRTGSSRHVKIFAIIQHASGPEIQDATHKVMRTRDLRYDEKRDTIVVRGSGFAVRDYLANDIAIALGITSQDVYKL